MTKEAKADPTKDINLTQDLGNDWQARALQSELIQTSKCLTNYLNLEIVMLLKILNIKWKVYPWVITSYIDHFQPQKQFFMSLVPTYKLGGCYILKYILYTNACYGVGGFHRFIHILIGHPSLVLMPSTCKAHCVFVPPLWMCHSKICKAFKQSWHVNGPMQYSLSSNPHHFSHSTHFNDFPSTNCSTVAEEFHKYMLFTSVLNKWYP